MTEQKKDVIHVVISSLTEPPYAERHVRWCERGGLNHPYSIFIVPEYRGCNPLADCNKNMILEQESAVIENDTCASSLPASTVTR